MQLVSLYLADLDVTIAAGVPSRSLPSTPFFFDGVHNALLHLKLDGLDQ